jgi:hypothetical protein
MDPRPAGETPVALRAPYVSPASGKGYLRRQWKPEKIVAIRQQLREW